MSSRGEYEGAAGPERRLLRDRRWRSRTYGWETLRDVTSPDSDKPAPRPPWLPSCLPPAPTIPSRRRRTRRSARRLSRRPHPRSRLWRAFRGDISPELGYCCYGNLLPASARSQILRLRPTTTTACFPFLLSSQSFACLIARRFKHCRLLSYHDIYHASRYNDSHELW